MKNISRKKVQHSIIYLRVYSVNRLTYIICICIQFISVMIQPRLTSLRCQTQFQELLSPLIKKVLRLAYPRVTIATQMWNQHVVTLTYIQQIGTPMYINSCLMESSECTLPTNTLHFRLYVTYPPQDIAGIDLLTDTELTLFYCGQQGRIPY